MEDLKETARPIDYEKIGYDIIGAAYEVYNHAGPSYREIFYEAALAYELRQKGYDVKLQVPIPVKYKGVEIRQPFVADMVVNDVVIIELKALRYFGNDVVRQLSSYLKLTGYKLGYIINFGSLDFGTSNLKAEGDPYYKGIYRMVNKL